MPTRGPKSGGPEDPTQKPKPFVDFSSIDSLIHKISESEQQRMARDAGETGWTNPNYFQETSQTDIPPLVPPRPQFRGTPPANRIRQPQPFTQTQPTTPTPTPGESPSGPPTNPPTDLHLYRGKPEQLASLAERAAIASRAAAYVRANRYSGKVLEQAKGLHEQLKGTGFEGVGKQAVIAASSAFQASQTAQRESRTSKVLHAIAKKTENIDDIERAKRQTLIANKARDLHEQSSNFAALFFRKIAEKGVSSVSETIKNSGFKGNQGWYDEWIKNQTNRYGRGGRGGGAGPPDNPPDSADDPDDPDEMRRRRNRKYAKGLSKDKLDMIRDGRSNFVYFMKQKKREQVQLDRDTIRKGKRNQKARRLRRERRNKIANANRFSRIRNLAKIGITASAIHHAASGDFMGAARRMAWASGNPAAIIGAELSEAAMTAVKALNQFSERTFEANKYLTNYSGKLAYATGTLELHEFQRTFKYSAGVSDTATDLVQSMDKMRDQWMKYNIASSNIANTVASLWTRFSGGFGEPLGKEAGVFAEVVRRFSSAKVGGIGVGDVASAAGTAAAEAEVSSLWGMLPGGPIVGEAARRSLAWLFKPAEVPEPGDTPVVTFLKSMRDRRERITPALREMERPAWKGGRR
jgi:hypothetical protein